MTIHTHLRLIEGGLATQPLSRAQTVALMADDLVCLDAFRTEHDAFRALYELKLYSPLEIAWYLPDAMQAAAQSVVAREMSEP